MQPAPPNKASLDLWIEVYKEAVASRNSTARKVAVDYIEKIVGQEKLYFILINALKTRNKLDRRIY